MLRIKIDTSGLDGLTQQIKQAASKAETAVAVQAKKDTELYVPMLTGSLAGRTQVVGNQIIYPGPYARYLYYGKVMVNAATGAGPMHFTDGYGNEVIRWPAGATLVATNRELVFTQEAHSKAQSHWFEASKAENLQKWLNVAQKAVTEDV
jgi:hypothetical protein